MDNSFLTQITNGTIDAVETGRGGSFVLVSYSDCPTCSRDNQQIRLNVTGNNFGRKQQPDTDNGLKSRHDRKRRLLQCHNKKYPAAVRSVCHTSDKKTTK